MNKGPWDQSEITRAFENFPCEPLSWVNAHDPSRKSIDHRKTTSRPLGTAKPAHLDAQKTADRPMEGKKNKKPRRRYRRPPSSGGESRGAALSCNYCIMQKSLLCAPLLALSLYSRSHNDPPLLHRARAASVGASNALTCG